MAIYSSDIKNLQFDTSPRKEPKLKSYRLNKHNLICTLNNLHR